MIVIMVALPQLNCGRATFTAVYTISSTIDVLVYTVLYNCILYIIVLNVVIFSFYFPIFVNSPVFCYESSIPFVYICVCLNIYLQR